MAFHRNVTHIRTSFSRDAANAQLVSCLVVSWYRWMKGGWQSCTVSCGGGMEQRSVYCVREDDEAAVSDDLCSDTKPSSSRPCNEQPCPVWFTGAWSLVRLCTPTSCTIKISVQTTSSIRATEWSFSMTVCGGGMSAAAPRVQLFVSASNGWSHNALRCH